MKRLKVLIHAFFIKTRDKVLHFYKKNIIPFFSRPIHGRETPIIERMVDESNRARVRNLIRKKIIKTISSVRNSLLNIKKIKHKKFRKPRQLLLVPRGFVFFFFFSLYFILVTIVKAFGIPFPFRFVLMLILIVLLYIIFKSFFQDLVEYIGTALKLPALLNISEKTFDLLYFTFFCVFISWPLFLLLLEIFL